MRREGWYALIAGLLCLALAGGWAAWKAPQFATPQMPIPSVNAAIEHTLPLPVPPQLNRQAARASDLAQLRKRHLFMIAPAAKPTAKPKPEPVAKPKPKPQETAKPSVKPKPEKQTAVPKPRSVIPDVSGGSETAPVASGAAAPQATAQSQPAHIGAGQSGQVLLRGILTSATETTALVQLPDKSIVDVRAGQMIGKWTVLVIDENGIVLGKGAEKVRLVLP